MFTLSLREGVAWAKSRSRSVESEHAQCPSAKTHSKPDTHLRRQHKRAHTQCLSHSLAFCIHEAKSPHLVSQRRTVNKCAACALAQTHVQRLAVDVFVFCGGAIPHRPERCEECLSRASAERARQPSAPSLQGWWLRERRKGHAVAVALGSDACQTL